MVYESITLRCGAMNSKAKGQRIERELAKMLEVAGYQVFRPSWVRFARKDIFGTFDILAVLRFPSPLSQEIALSKPIVFAQVKSHPNGYYSAKGKVREWAESVVLCECVLPAVYLRLAPKRWRVWAYTRGGEKEWEVKLGF